MIICALDYSKNSPALCIRTDDDIQFISFLRSNETKRNLAHFNSLRDRDVKIILNPRSTKLKEYTELEGYKIEDATLLSETIISMIPDKADMIGMEGFSYGSKGNAALDIAGYAYCMRKALYQKFGRDKLCIFSPGNVKKLAGKGNAGKDEMMNFFLGTEDKTLKDTKFWQGLYNGEINKSDKPVDDLCDSFFIQECSRRYYNSKLIGTIIK